jgi:hypothetical protein
LIRISIGSWSSILEITVTLVSTLPGNSDGSTAVCDAIGERVNVTSLVTASKTKGIVLSVNCNVLLMATLKLLDGSLDILHAARLAHILTREVAVKTSSVPVTRNWLGVERDLGAKLLSNAVKKETGKPKVITQLNAFTRSNLELPLGGHDLGVGTRDLDAGEQASLEMSLNDVSAVDFASTNTTVVWTLRSRESANGPAIRPVVHVEQGIFLLKTKPWLLSLVGLHKLSTLMAVVELVWCPIGVPALADDQDIRGATEWIWEDSNGSEVDIRVVAWGLAGGAAVEVPLGEILNLELAAFGNFGESL